MSRDTDISDETLTAFLDGALSHADAKRVSDAIEFDPNLAARLEALSIPLDDLRPAFDTMLDDAPANLVPNPPSHTQFGILPTAIAASVVLAAGIAIGAYVTKPAPSPGGWHAYVAAYQALYVEDTLNIVEQTAAETQSQLTRVSASLGRELDSAIQVPGLAYKRAQVLGFKGKPLVQLAYLSESGAPLALCIIRSEKSDAIKSMKLEGLEAASWSDGTFAYLLIGGKDPDQIEAAATHLQAQL